MLCVWVVDVMDVVFSVCIVRRGAVGARFCFNIPQDPSRVLCGIIIIIPCIGSVSVSSCRCCMFVSCVYPVAVLNAAFCI